MKFDSSDCVIQALRTATILWRESRRFFQPFGITDAQFNVLNLLAQAPDGLSQRELSDLLVVDRSNVTLLLDRMAGKGWIERPEVAGDRRKYRVALTAGGRGLWKRVHPAYLAALAGVVRGVPERAGEIALQVLQTIEKQAASWRKDLKGK